MIQEPYKPMWFTHPRRGNIFDEADQVIKQKKADREETIQQIEYYKNKGYQDCGLYLNGFFIRRHNDDINHLHDVWYRETCRYTQRDQLSLPYAMWLTGICPENIYTSQEKEQYAYINGTPYHTSI